jgi:alanyl-tRNA synthetase
VLRRLLRRAYRFGRELGLHEPFLYKLVPTVLENMGAAFPEIKVRKDYCISVIQNEEERFGQTLEQGIEKFSQMLDSTRKKGGNVISGTDVFTLYDTYGFPMDLTRLMAMEKGFTVDEQGYDTLMEQQKVRGRDAIKKGDASLLTPDGWVVVLSGSGTEFVGYDEEKTAVKIRSYKDVPQSASKKKGAEYLFIFDKTPFYAESGGQIGDRGTLLTAGGVKLDVQDTFKWNDAIVHKVSSSFALTNQDFSSPIVAQVHHDDRGATRRNHSATHLLQAALRKILGTHIQQSGSRVDHLSFRFDFTHFKSMTPDEILAVELKVNEWVLSDFPVVTTVEDTEKAKNTGAMALFGEKYGERVRVVTMGDVSKELCGGTHTASTGQIGLFHITAESSISAGVRRIEGITGLNTLQAFREKSALISSLSRELKISESGLFKRVTEVLSENDFLKKSNEKFSAEKYSGQVSDILSHLPKSGPMLSFVSQDLGVTAKDGFNAIIDAISDRLKLPEYRMCVVVLSAIVDDRPQLFAAAGQSAVKEADVHCGNIVKEAAMRASGSGGGSPIRGQAGCKDPAKLNEALAAAQEILKNKAGSTN